MQFTLTKRDFAYYEEKVKGWFVESGAFEIAIGASSRDIKLTSLVQFCSNDEMPMHYTKFSTIGELLKTKRGKVVMEELFTLLGRPMKQEDDALGEGSGKMKQAMMMEMPLVAFNTYGIITEEKLRDLLKALQL